MSINQIRLYDLFRKELPLPDEKAASFVNAMNEAIVSKNVNTCLPLEAKVDKLELKMDKLETKVDKLETKVDMLNSGLLTVELKIEQSKTDIFKAMFWTGIVQLISILGGTLAIVKFLK